MQSTMTPINKTEQVEAMEQFLAWIKTCPYPYGISSMSGGFMHVKFMIPAAQMYTLADAKSGDITSLDDLNGGGA